MNARCTPMTLVAAAAATAAVDGAGLRLSFSVPAGSAIFAGHYPHHPLVPGLYLVEAALQALAQAVGASGLRRIGDLRLMHAVEPDAVIDLHAQRVAATDTATRWQVSLVLAGRTAARFKLDYEAGCGPATAAAATALPPPLEAGSDWSLLGPDQVLRLLAHRSPILLVDEARVQPDGQALVAHKAVSLNEPCYAGLSSAPAASELHYPAVLVIESFVQASGLLIGQHLASADVMVLGGLRGAELLSPALPGNLLRHELRVLRRLGDAALVGGATFVGRRAVAVVHEVLIAVRSAQALRPSTAVAKAAISPATGASGATLLDPIGAMT